MKVRRVTSSEGFGGINQSLAPLLRALHLAAEFCYFPDWIKKQSCTKIQDEHHNMAADGVASPQLSLSAALALSIQLYGLHQRLRTQCVYPAPEQEVSKLHP